MSEGNETDKNIENPEMSEYGEEIDNMSNENEDCAIKSIELRRHNSYNTVSV